MDHPRCFKIRRAIRQALAGTSVQHLTSLHGLLVWAATVLPHTRALTGCIMREIQGKPDHAIHKPSAEVAGNLQRLLNIFRRPPMIPLYNLLVLVPPQITIYTDASGGMHKGTTPYWGGYDDLKDKEWFFTHPIPRDLWTSTPECPTQHEPSTSTALLEMLALYILLHTGTKDTKSPMASASDGIPTRRHASSHGATRNHTPHSLIWL